jgi:hypothetical protein
VGGTARERREMGGHHPHPTHKPETCSELILDKSGAEPFISDFDVLPVIQQSL